MNFNEQKGKFAKKITIIGKYKQIDSNAGTTVKGQIKYSLLPNTRISTSRSIFRQGKRFRKRNAKHFNFLLRSPKWKSCLI